MDLSKIKNRKLVKLIEESAMFKALSEAEQEKEIESISKLKSSQQEGMISEFFAKSNAKEQEEQKKKNQMLKEIIEKLKEMDTILKKMERVEIENIDQQEEKQKEESLMNQLNNL